jgi:hypothetical protein
MDIVNDNMNKKILEDKTVMNVELSKFKVKKGKETLVDEWLKFLNDNMEDVLLTLKDEKMYVETIFQEKTSTGEYLYWFSIQGDGGLNVEESSHEVDKKHVEYWYECIDEEVPHVDLNAEVIMIQNSVRKTLS